MVYAHTTHTNKWVTICYCEQKKQSTATVTVTASNEVIKQQCQITLRENSPQKNANSLVMTWESKMTEFSQFESEFAI